MIRNREKTFLKGLFLIVLFYTIVQHFSVVRNVLTVCYDAISPLIYGVVIAFIVNLIVVKLEKYMTGGIFKNHTVKRATSIVAALLILIGVITLVIFNMIPGIADSVKQIAEKAPGAIRTGIEFLETNFGLPGELKSYVDNIEVDEELINSVMGLFENKSFLDAVKAGGSAVGNVFSVFVKFFIGLFFAFYILAKKEAIGEWLLRFIRTYFPKHIAEGMEHVGKLVYNTYANFISGQCVDAMILGTLMAICMGIMGMPYAVLIGVIIAVTALIPVVGAFFGGAIGMLLIVMESPLQAIMFLVVFLVLQTIDNRLIYPHIVGNAIGIPSILIFAAIIIGGEFGGVLGMFLFIPLTAVIAALIEEDMERRRLKKEAVEQAAQELQEETIQGKETISQIKEGQKRK
ncbi:MAG: AI-2E family transporter [Lachnospiraceae bacterium]|nr:AI-2E family transporter [Lachnospiraceae bacterium]